MVWCIFSEFIFFLREISRAFWKIWFVCWRRARFFSFRWKICRSSSTIWFVSWLSRRSFCVSGSMFCMEWKKVGWGKKFIEREREKRYDWHICCQKKKWNLFQSKKIYTSCCLQVTRIRNTLQTRSTLKSRFVSNSRCNLIFFLDFFEDHVVNLKKKVFNRISNISWIPSLCWTFFNS